MYKELVLHFILGGILFSTIYYVANIVEDPSLSAVIALIPIVILAGFIIKKVDTCQKYYENAVYVLVITFLLVLLLIQLLKINKYPKNILISIVLLFWIILQFCRHKYFDN
jgi:uncharacterized membrane protein YoaK (UPF0700 family)